MKRLLHLTCVAYIVLSATAMMPYNTHNHAKISEVFEQFSDKERDFFIRLSGETLNAGYYSQLQGLSHKMEVAHMKEIVEGNVRTMKRSDEYYSILHTTGPNRQHITQYLEQCYELGVEHARHANRNGNGTSLRPGDIYASLYEEKAPTSLPSLPHLPSGEQVAKVLLVSFLILLTFAAIAGLIGACVCPQLPIFGRVRTLLEY